VLFNSHEYLFLFLPLTLIVYFLINRWERSGHLPRRVSDHPSADLPVRLPWLWLICASLIFYGWSEPRHILLLVWAVLFNFSVGSLLKRSRPLKPVMRQIVLALGVTADIALLGYYKYTDFVITNSNYLLHTQFPLRSLAVPIGLSFITFIQISYLIDSYRNPAHRYNLLDYTLFSAYFPYILAGPIVSHSEIMPQLKNGEHRAANYRNLSIGLYLLSIGLFKKVVVADRLGEWANQGFAAAAPLNFLYAWVTSLCYTFQIYFDFSGYTDMAIGSALMFNIRLPINFNSPYKALDIQDFWRRWHITLGRFLREYIYIPLGGSRVKEPRIYFNLLVTFIVCGVWHGAGWTFAIWGFLHGAALVINRAWKKVGGKMPALVAWLLTFTFVNMAWVFFRARSWNEALKMLSAMCGLNGIALPSGWGNAFSFLQAHYIQFIPWKEIMQGSRDACIWIPLALAACLALKNSNQMAESFRPGWRALAVVAAGAYAALQLFKINEFLYLNF
jgi:alginate O-acetyltransferase complex protein AlgI